MRLATSLIVQPDAVTISRKPLPGCGGFFIIFFLSSGIQRDPHLRLHHPQIEKQCASYLTYECSIARFGSL